MPSKANKRKQRQNKKASEVTAKPTETSVDDGEKKVSKKRDKKLMDPNHVHESKGQSKALRYLKLWYDAKKGRTAESWKFEKCRQIWLLQNCYNQTKLTPEDFKVFLKYAATIQGRMRQGALGRDFLSVYFKDSPSELFANLIV